VKVVPSLGNRQGGQAAGQLVRHGRPRLGRPFLLQKGVGPATDLVLVIDLLVTDVQEFFRVRPAGRGDGPEHTSMQSAIAAAVSPSSFRLANLPVALSKQRLSQFQQGVDLTVFEQLREKAL